MRAHASAALKPALTHARIAYCLPALTAAPKEEEEEEPGYEVKIFVEGQKKPIAEIEVDGAGTLATGDCWLAIARCILRTHFCCVMHGVQTLI